MSLKKSEAGGNQKKNGPATESLEITPLEKGLFVPGLHFLFADNRLLNKIVVDLFKCIFFIGLQP